MVARDTTVYRMSVITTQDTAIRASSRPRRVACFALQKAVALDLDCTLTAQDLEL